MLSTDLENLACALEQTLGEFSVDHATFLELVCANLHSLAHRVEILESVPLAKDSLIPLQ